VIVLTLQHNLSNREDDMAEQPFDPTVYVRAPIIQVASGISLARGLLVAVPKHAPAAVKAKARQLKASAATVQTAWKAQHQAATPAERKRADTVIDNGWGALVDRLHGMARLPADTYPDATRAAEIVHLLFYPGGLGFLTYEFDVEWAESQKRLELIDERGLAADIDRLAGPAFLEHVRAAHQEYGRVLGKLDPLPGVPSVPGLLEPLRQLSTAIRDYTLQLAAWGSAEATAMPAVRAALGPIDEFRARHPGTAHTPAGGDAAAAGDAADHPLPEVPADGHPVQG
jgi:hypothetical protein